LVECEAELISDLFPLGPVVSHVILCSFLLNDTFDLRQYVLFVVDIVYLVHLWKSISDKFILERERHRDGYARANTDWFLFTSRQISEVNIDLRAWELYKLVERPNDVPAPFIDLCKVDILRQRVILQPILDWLNCTCTEG